MAQVLCKTVPKVNFGNYKYRCGQLAVALSLFATDKCDEVSDSAPTVASTTAGGLLPRDTSISLNKLGITTETTCLQLEPPAEKILWLQNLIHQKKPALLFTGHSIGHWIIVWGYDKMTGDFLVFDGARAAKRREDGLTVYSQDKLLADWNKLPWTVRYLTNPIAKLFPKLRERLHVDPATAVMLL